MVYDITGAKLVYSEAPGQALNKLLDAIPYINSNGKDIKKGFLDEIVYGVNAVYQYPGILKLGTGRLYNYNANGVNFPAVDKSGTFKYVYTEFGYHEYLTGVRYELINGEFGIIIPDEATIAKISITPSNATINGFVMRYDENTDSFVQTDSFGSTAVPASINLSSATKRHLLINISAITNVTNVRISFE